MVIDDIMLERVDSILHLITISNETNRFRLEFLRRRFEKRTTRRGFHHRQRLNLRSLRAKIRNHHFCRSGKIDVDLAEDGDFSTEGLHFVMLRFEGDDDVARCF